MNKNLVYEQYQQAHAHYGTFLSIKTPNTKLALGVLFNHKQSYFLIQAEYYNSYLS